MKTMKKLIYILLLTITTSLLLSVTSYADVGDRYRIDEINGHWYALGGINQYEGIPMENREETEILEDRLLAEDYVRISGNDKQISQEEYDLFVEYKPFWFTPYMSTEQFYLDNYVVYAYRPSFEAYMEQIKDGVGGVANYLVLELNSSTVVINYEVWDISEKVGTISDEFNENLPDYRKGVYMEIRSPVNCQVILLHSETRQYYVFWVEREVPFKVKIRRGIYHIVKVNETDINNNITDSGEDTLPYNNQIVLGEVHTEDNPYIVELYKLVEKHNIKDMNIDDKPNFTYGESVTVFDVEDITEESTIIGNVESEEKQKSSTENIIIIVIIVAIVIGLIIYGILKFKEEAEEGDNDE